MKQRMEVLTNLLDKPLAQVNAIAAFCGQT